MKAIEKLRNAIVKNTSPGGWEHDTVELYADELSSMVDEIERELSERYMALPCDADGVPICVEDKMVDCLGYEFVVCLVGVDCVADADGVIFDSRECNHVKPDPIKELLQEFEASSRALERMDAYPNPNNPRPLDYDSEFKGLIEEYATKLREAMGGDVE